MTCGRNELRCRGGRGSSGVEAALAVTALLAVMFFVIGALRITNSAGDVAAAARAAARAAAAERSAGSGQQAAATVAGATLAARGVACAGGPSVAASGNWSSGGVVAVSVTCSISLSDVVVGGFPGSRTVSGRAVEYVDSVRSGG